MLTSLKRVLRKVRHLKTVRYIGSVIVILFVLHINGWLSNSSNNDQVKELGLLDPELQQQQIQSLKRHVRELQQALRATGLPAPEHPPGLPTIYVITPTYARPNQLAELNRLRAVFLHVSRLWWVVVEDSEQRSVVIRNFLAEAGVPYTHLAQPTPQDWKLGDQSPRWRRPRGVLQRNAAIAWLRHNCSPDSPAVAYFADDDNSYHTRLFDEMRWTGSVSVWPVGLVGGVMVERPVCQCQHGGGTVSDWIVGWKPERKFPTDMAGFAMNMQLLLSHPEAEFSHSSNRGFLETDFLSLLGMERRDLEPRADCCTKVLVWHMNAKRPDLKDEYRLQQLGKRTDADIVV